MLALAFALTAVQAVTEAYEFVNPDLIRGHVEYLASDALEGRGAGQRGGELAARYIAAQFRRLRLQPGGANGTYFQRVPLAFAVGDDGSALTYAGTKGTAHLRAPGALVVRDACPGPTMLEGPLAFVGYAISAPADRYDDLATAELGGKIALALWGYPPGLGERAGVVLGADPSVKAATVRGRGARGLLIVADEPSGTFAFQRIGPLPWGAPAGWAAPGFGAPDAIISDSAFRAIAEAGGWNSDSLRAAAKTGRAATTEFGGTVSLSKRARFVTASAWNVIAIVPGSDPRVRHEAIVVTAHYDALGIGPKVDGDSIYNGAVSGAVGIAKLLALAEAFAAHPGGRTTVILADGAGALGRLGTWHYIAQAVWPLPLTVAAISVDGGFDALGVTLDVTAPVSELSTLHDMVQRAARIMALRVTADPAGAPAFGWAHLAHLPFLIAGIPAVTIAPGVTFRGKPKEWGAELRQRFVLEHYDRPSDEVRDDFDYRGPVGTAQTAYALGRILTDREEKPLIREAPSSRIGTVPAVACPGSAP